MTRLYAIVDPAFCRGRDPAEVAAEAVRGGATVVQYRWKGPEDRPAECRRVVEAARAAGAETYVNDRIDWALAAGADGVHVGRGDAPVAEVRARARGLDRPLKVGRSTHSVDEALGLDVREVAYVSLGPVFPTTSKADAEPVVGLDALRLVCSRSARPVCAIGGISVPERARACARAGAAYVAIMSAICDAGDVEAAARAFAAALVPEPVRA